LKVQSSQPDSIEHDEIENILMGEALATGRSVAYFAKGNPKEKPHNYSFACPFKK
jgi:hypothetical protein